MLECVINVSEGRDETVIHTLATVTADALLDVHTDPQHHRSVFTLSGPEVERAARDLCAVAVARIDLRLHGGAHPRFGVVDVVPFVPLTKSSMADAIEARDRFAGWAGGELGLPCFLYGPERSLPELRRMAFKELAPDRGPSSPHPSAGAIAIGARPVLVAYNLWLAPGVPVARAREVAAELRGPAVRALGLDLGDRVQVSCNLIDPLVVGPDAVFDAVAREVEIDRAELVGLAPATVLAALPVERWAELDLSPSRTIEARLGETGLDGGSRTSAGREER